MPLEFVILNGFSLFLLVVIPGSLVKEVLIVERERSDIQKWCYSADEKLVVECNI